MAGAVVSTQLHSGRPPRKRGPSVPQSPASGIWVPACAGTTLWCYRPRAPPAPLSLLSISTLRVVVPFRFMYTFVSSLPVISRAAFASRAAILCFAAPRMRDGGAPGRVTGIPVALARRNALPPVRREGASRRSTWRFSAARPALRLPAVPTGIRAATWLTAGHNVPTARSRASRGCSSLRRLGTPLPAAPSGRHRRRPARAR